MAKKKKRKFKKGFKALLWLIILLLIAGGLFYLNNKKIISFQNIWTETSNKVLKIKDYLEKKEKSTDETIENSLTDIFEKDNINKEEYIRIFRTRLPSKNLNFASSSEPSLNGDIKIFLQGTREEMGYLYVNINNDPEYVWITFVSAVDAEPLKTDLKKKLKYLDYLDLRFSNKVFYRFHKENEIIPTVNTNTNIEVSTEIATSTTETN